jgi:hypothetical protein
MAMRTTGAQPQGALSSQILQRPARGQGATLTLRCMRCHRPFQQDQEEALCGYCVGWLELWIDGRRRCRA